MSVLDERSVSSSQMGKDETHQMSVLCRERSWQLPWRKSQPTRLYLTWQLMAFSPSL